MLKVRELSGLALADLESVREQLGFEDDSNDMTLIEFINRASSRIAGVCKRNLLAADRVYTLDGTGTPEIIIPDYPVNSLDHAAYRLGEWNADYIVDLTDYSITDYGVVWLPRNVFPRGTQNVRLTANTGYDADIPAHALVLDDLRDVCIDVVRVYWQRQTNQIGDVADVSVGGRAERFIDEGLPASIIRKLYDLHLVRPT